MQYYLKHRKSLVSKGKKKSSVATPTSSAPSVPPSATSSTTVSVAPPTPTLTSVASDQSIKDYVHLVLASFLSQPASQISLGFNSFVSAPMVEVPNVSHRGSTGGSDAESLMRGRQVAPSGMVPRPQEKDVISSPIMSMSVASGRFDSISGPHIPSLGQVSAPVSWVNERSHVHGATGFGLGNVTVNVSDVDFPPASTSFDPFSLLFPSSDSGFASIPFSRPSSSSTTPSLPLYVSAPFISSLAPSAPSASFPIFSLPSVVPSLLSFSSSVPRLTVPPFPHLSTSFAAPASSHTSALSFSAPSFPSAPAPPPGFSAPASVPLSFLSSASSAPSAWPVASAPSLASPGVPLGFPSVSSASSSSFGDFAECQARVLGLSAEYQALGRWFVGSGGSDFPAYLSAHCPHLYSDFRIDFSSGSFRFLAALASSASLPPPSSAAPLPSSSISPFSSSAPAFSSAPLAPSAHPSSSLAPSFPSAPLSVSLAPPSVRFPPVSSSASQPFRAWGAVPGGSGVASVAGSVAAPFPVPPPISAPSLFRPFAADSSSSVPVSSAPLPSDLSSTPFFSSRLLPIRALFPLLLFLLLLLLSFLRMSCLTMLLRMLCRVMSTRLFLLRFRIPLAPSFVGCSILLLTFFRKLLVLLLLLLLALFSKTSLVLPLLLPLLSS